MNKGIILAIVIIVVVGAIILFTSGPAEAPMSPTENDVSDTWPTGSPEPGNATSTDTPMVKEFMVEGSNYKFSVTEMRVNLGDTVRVVFKNTGGQHDWKVDEFDAETRVLSAGEQETIEFVADKAGTFEYYCSVMQHRQMGMVGSLIVE